MCRAAPSGGINTWSRILLCSDYFKAFRFNIHSCLPTWPQRWPARWLPLSGALRVDCDWRELGEKCYLVLWMHREKGGKRREKRSLWWALTHTQPLCSPDWDAAGHLSPSHTGSQAAVFSCLHPVLLIQVSSCDALYTQSPSPHQSHVSLWEKWLNADRRV